jgi:hypothetical protein
MLIGAWCWCAKAISNFAFFSIEWWPLQYPNHRRLLITSTCWVALTRLGMVEDSGGEDDMLRMLEVAMAEEVETWNGCWLKWLHHRHNVLTCMHQHLNIQLYRRYDCSNRSSFSLTCSWHAYVPWWMCCIDVLSTRFVPSPTEYSPEAVNANKEKERRIKERIKRKKKKNFN